MRTRVLTITLAAVLALLGVVAILAYVRQANERAVNGLKAETVVVATGPIAANTSLSKAKQAGLLSTEEVPVSSVNQPALHSVTAANEHLVVTGTVAKGQVLLRNMLAVTASNAAANGGFVVPQGMVAVSVDMCVPEDVANYVTPGSNVAVFDTLVAIPASVTFQPSCSAEHPAFGNNAITNTGDAATVLVLPKVEVLAVGQNPGSQSTSGGSNAAAATDPASSSSSSSDVLVTFAVDQQDAERLIALQEVGIPYLALLGSNASLQPNGPVQLFQQQLP